MIPIFWADVVLPAVPEAEDKKHGGSGRRVGGRSHAFFHLKEISLQERNFVLYYLHPKGNYNITWEERL